MPLLDRDTLNAMGIILREEDYELLAEHFESTLQERVINEIVDELSVDQAKELAAMKNADDGARLNWLHANVADFSQIVSDEVDILLGELAENSEAISVS